MARTTVVQLVDDLDGSEIDDGETVTFSHQGVAYEIDLGSANAQRLHDALAPYIAAGRQVGTRRTSTVTSGPSAGDREQLQAIRTWGRENGFTVNDRGRVSKELHEAYHAAQ